MLWIYINNQGVAECVVNVGNRIRQGDRIPLFVVLEGQQTDSAICSINRIAYLKPGAKEFVNIPDIDTEHSVTKTFVLDDPSKANSVFIGGQEYTGFEAVAPKPSTSFEGNGGHVAFEIVLQNNATAEFIHAQTVSVFVEPTYGKHGTTITSEDYSALVNLIRSMDLKVSYPMIPVAENGVSTIDGKPGPIISCGKAMGFVRGVLKVYVPGLKDGQSAPSQDEEDDGYASMVTVATNAIGLTVNCEIMGRDQYGNDIRMRVNGANEGIISVDAKISDLQISGDELVRLTYFGTCPAYVAFLDFTTEYDGVVSVIGVTSSCEQVGPDYDPQNMVEITLVPLPDDESKAYLDFKFKVYKAVKIGGSTANVDITGRPSGTDPYAAVEVHESGPDSDNKYGMHFDFTLGVPQGANGIVTESSGMIGFQVIDGQLWAYTPGEGLPGVEINDQGQLVYTY